MGHRQTVQTWRLLRFSTVCLRKFLLKYEIKRKKIPPNNPKIGNSLVQLIMMGNTFGINGIIVFSDNAQRKNVVQARECRLFSALHSPI